MRRKALRWLVPLALFAGAAAICGSCCFWPGAAIPSEIREVFDEADEWEVYSLFPVREEESLPERFQGWPVLGKTTVRDAPTLRRLREALARGTQRYHQWVPGPMCFFPRHGIHATHGGKSVDLAICFECSYVYQNDVEVFRTTAAPQPVFDAVLTEAGIPLAPSGPPPWKLPKIPRKEGVVEPPDKGHTEK
jgi:hypothetical protein